MDKHKSNKKRKRLSLPIWPIVTSHWISFWPTDSNLTVPYDISPPDVDTACVSKHVFRKIMEYMDVWLPFLPVPLLALILDYSCLCYPMDLVEYKIEEWLDRGLHITRPLQVLVVNPIHQLVTLLTIRAKFDLSGGHGHIIIENKIFQGAFLPLSIDHRIRGLFFGETVGPLNRMSDLFAAFRDFGFCFDLNQGDNLWLRDVYHDLCFA